MLMIVYILYYMDEKEYKGETLLKYYVWKEKEARSSYL